MAPAAAHEHCIREALIPPALCRELKLLHLACAVPGYRPNCTACTLLASPPWGWPALLRARELARDAAEDFFDEFGGLWPETTVTVCWFPGSSLPVHTDNCKDYLSKRHISVVIWLSSQGEDFDGGEFFFQGARSGDPAEVVMPRAGSAALFTAEEPHGLREVVRGARLALNIWFTRDPSAAEDVRLLKWQPPSSIAERLFGAGPQACWPPGRAAVCLAKRTLAQAGLPPRGQPLRPRKLGRGGSKQNAAGACPCCPPAVDEGRVLPPARRVNLAVAAFRRLCAGSSCAGRCFLQHARQRERQVRAAMPRWHAHGLVSFPNLKRKVSCGCLRGGRVEFVKDVPGLVIARGALDSRLQRGLGNLADGLLTCNGKLMNQAMRFGKDMPVWANTVVRRTGLQAGRFSK